MPSPTQATAPSPWPDCVEHGVWTNIPTAPPDALDDFTLKFSHVDPAQNDAVKQAGKMTFHATGCAGDYEDHTAQQSVADAMTQQVASPGTLGLPNSPAAPAAFFYHLGDISYKPDPTASTPDGTNPTPDEKLTYDEAQMLNEQFYRPYTAYNRSIFAVAGNHDGKFNAHNHKCAISHFLLNFCAQTATKSPDNTTDNRPAMTQPYPYWRLDTPLAYFIGLYTNVANGGILDDPDGKDTPQYDWLVAQLKDVAKHNAQNNPRRAVFLMVHYPPYSATTNFAQRGDPRLGPSNAANALPLGVLLQNAFAKADQWPDAVFCAHTHLYQRLTYTRPAGKHAQTQIPYVIVGSGGHTIEKIGEPCAKSAPDSTPPYAPVFPHKGAPPDGETVTLARYDDAHFGFLRVTVTPEKLTGEYFIVHPGGKQMTPAPAGNLPRLADAFELNLLTHQVTDLLPAP